MSSPFFTLKSMKEIETTGELSEDGGGIVLHFPALMRRLARGLVGKKLIVKFEKYFERRSNAQNRYMWGVVVPTVRAWLLETTGEKYTADEVYYWLNQEVLRNKPKVTLVNGIDVITLTGKRFSQMSTKEFAEAVEELFKYFAEKNLVIPIPNEQNFTHDHVGDV